MQRLHGLHAAVPDRRDRQLAQVLRVEAYPIDEQLTWDVLPAREEHRSTLMTTRSRRRGAERSSTQQRPVRRRRRRCPARAVPPWSAAHPYVNLYTHRAPATATVVGNFRVTDADSESDTHHIVLDFGATPFPVLEGQSIGILPPGTDAHGRAASRAPVFDRRARATASVPATTTSRSP